MICPNNVDKSGNKKTISPQELAGLIKNKGKSSSLMSSSRSSSMLTQKSGLSNDISRMISATSGFGSSGKALSASPLQTNNNFNSYANSLATTA